MPRRFVRRPGRSLSPHGTDTIDDRLVEEYGGTSAAIWRLT